MHRSNDGVKTSLYMLRERERCASKQEMRLPRVKKKNENENEFRLSSTDFGFICDGVSTVDGYKKVVVF